MSTTAKVRERPVIFSGPMVRALLDGRKTMTRRTVFKAGEAADNHMPWRVAGTHWQDGDEMLRCPFHVGMSLWVRETWTRGDTLEPDVLYRADDERFGRVTWRPSIFMPRWASRITLRITEVRAERLGQITEEDAIAEGFQSSTGRWWQGFQRLEDGSRGMVEGGASPDGPPPDWMESPELQTMTTTAVERFRSLWHQLNGKRNGCSWAHSPWVWVIGFERIPQP